MGSGSYQTRKLNDGTKEKFDFMEYLFGINNPVEVAV